MRANSYISLIIPVSRQTFFVASSHPEKYFSFALDSEQHLCDFVLPRLESLGFRTEQAFDIIIGGLI